MKQQQIGTNRSDSFADAKKPKHKIAEWDITKGTYVKTKEFQKLIEQVKQQTALATLKKIKARGIKSFKDYWKPYCFGDYQGIGDVSCFNCVFNSQGECSAFMRKRAEIKKLSEGEKK